MRYRTDDDRLIRPRALPTESRGAVWQCDGRAEDVLAELFELPDIDPIAPWPWMQPGARWHAARVWAMTAFGSSALRP